MLTTDPVTSETRPHPAALRRDDGISMSSHSRQLLEDLGRDLMTVYPTETHGSVCFPVSSATDAGAAAVHSPVVDVAEDPDPDRRAAHCDVYPHCGDTEAEKKAQWKLIANAISSASTWVQPIT
ncbi:hypothetical protein GCM10025872_02590 [Barrientosiimonas endolithica]|uniref:Uncharacterized protein n=1 Tax=Barrientosiimonas endolithica TaxID=1535208 RepID=A0ABM8H6X3_9MICO|nr:hypothetical protein GCM10025872_02590 [Barrientosiimonas endolithica]